MGAHPLRPPVMSEHPGACTCREHPLPASMRVGDALAAYLAENGFTTAGYESPTTEGSFLGRRFAVPNPPAHQRALRFHDLHHVATGFGTDHAGEGEISAWQARRGLSAAGLYVLVIVATNVLVGVVLAPRRTLRTLRSAGSGASLFDVGQDYAALLALRVGELRALLGIPERGLATRPRGLHAHAPR
jgi:hypothetical protein